MVQTGKADAEVAQFWTLAEHGGWQFDVAYNGDVGVAHALDERMVVLAAVHIIGEGMAHCSVMGFEAFKAGLGDTQ